VGLNFLVNSRTKGRAGEQEIARTLRDELGLEVTRNWQQQAAQGGVDIVGVPGWAIEVKRAKQWSNDWWTQATAQAVRTGENPVLLYRLDRKPWRARCCACAVGLHLHFQMEMDLLDWVSVVREQLCTA
jgi:Holliday junction resolvase